MALFAHFMRLGAQRPFLQKRVSLRMDFKNALAMEILEFQPKVITFPQVRLGQLYQTTLHVVNHTKEIEFTLPQHTDRCTVEPWGKLTLTAGKALAITIKLKLEHYPANSSPDKPVRDHLRVSSRNFEKQIPIDIWVSRAAGSRSVSPIGMKAHARSRPEKAADPKEAEVRDLIDELGDDPRIRDIVDFFDSRHDHSQEVCHKAFKLLNQKDIEIASIKAQLEEEQAKTEDLLRSQTLRGSQDHPSTSPASRLVEQLKKDKKSLKDQLEDAHRTNAELEQQVNEMKETQARRRDRPAHSQDVQELKRQLADKDQQMDVLLEELSKNQKDEAQEAQHHHDQQQEITVLRKTLKDCEKQYSDVQHAYARMVAERSAGTGPMFEEQVEGGFATSTPYDFDHPRMQQRTQVRHTNGQLAAENKALKDKLNLMAEEQARMQQSNAALHAQVQQQLQHQVEMQLQHLDKASPPVTPVRPVTPPVAVAPISPCDVTAVHEWWSYVWHAAQSQGPPKPGDLDYHPEKDSDEALHVHRLTEELRQAVMEIASARQDVLLCKFEHRQITSKLTSELAELKSVNEQLHHRKRMDSEKSSVLLASLESEVRILANKSQQHGQFHATASELISEKTLNVNLRLHLQEAQQQLEEERRRFQDIVRVNHDLQADLDSRRLLGTLEKLPGVSISQAIALFSREVVASKGDVEKLQAALRDSQAQLLHEKQQNRQLQQQSQAQAEALASASKPKPSARLGRSPSPLRRSYALDTSSSPEDIPSPSQMRYQLVPKVVLSEDTTSVSWLAALDRAMLVNQLSAQGDLIQRLTSAVAHTDLHDADIITMQEREQYESLGRKLVLAEAKIADLHSECKELSEVKREMEKELITWRTTHSNCNHRPDDADGSPPSTPPRDGNDAIHLRNLLKDRDMEIKVLSDTVAALAGGNGAPPAQVSGLSASSLFPGDMHETSNEAVSHPMVSALTKRLLEMQSAHHRILRQCRQLADDKDSLQVDKEKHLKKIVKLSNKLASFEDERNVLQQQLAALQEGKQLTALKELDEQRRLEVENGELVATVSRYEYELQAMQLKVEEARASREDVEKAAEDVRADLLAAGMMGMGTDNWTPFTPPPASPASPSNELDGLQGMISDLLKKWKQPSPSRSRSPFQRSASVAGQQLSQEEVEYVNKISNVVLTAQQQLQSVQSSQEMAAAQIRNLQEERAIMQQKFTLAIQQLVIYKKRINYSSVPQHQVVAKDRHALSLIKKHKRAVEQQNHTLQQTARQLHSSRTVALLQVKQLEGKVRQLEACILSVECKGSQLTQAKEYLQEQLARDHHRIVDEVQAWFKQELFQLVHNLPVGDMHQLESGYLDDFDGKQAPANPKTGIDALFLGDQQDNAYLQAAALCEMKAKLVESELQADRLSKEVKQAQDKLLHFENLLYKYKHLQHTEEDMISMSDAQRMASLSHEKESMLIARIDQLEASQQALEEDNIMLSEKNRIATLQLENYKQLIGEYASSESSSKVQYQRNISKLRGHLEKEHIQLQRELREGYEKERRGYIEELNALTDAVQGMGGEGVEGEEETKMHWRPPLREMKQHLRDVYESDYLPSRGQWEGQNEEKQDLSAASAVDVSRAPQPHAGPAQSDAAPEVLVSTGTPAVAAAQAPPATTPTAPVVPSMPSALPPLAPPTGPRQRLSDPYSPPDAPYSAPDQHHINSIADLSDSSTNSATGVVQKMQLEKMHRLLEIERRKVAEAKQEAQELQQLLRQEQAQMEKLQEHQVQGQTAMQTESKGENVSKVVLEDIRQQLQNLQDRLDGPEADLLKIVIAQLGRWKSFAIPATAPAPASASSVAGSSIDALHQQIASLAADIDHQPSAMQEKEICLLRDLRGKVRELEEAFHSQLAKEREEYNNSRAEMLVKINSLQALVEQTPRAAEPITGGGLKEEYEQRITDIETDYHKQSAIFKMENHRLEDALAQKTAMLANLERDNAYLMNMVHNSPTDALNDLVKLQQLYGQSQKELTAANHSHQRDLAQLQSNFQKYRYCQEELIRNLEEQLEDLGNTANSSGGSMSQLIDGIAAFGARQDDTRDSLGDGEDKYRKLEYLYKSKCSQLDVAMRAINHIGDQSDAASSAPSERSSIPDRPIPSMVGETRGRDRDRDRDRDRERNPSSRPVADSKSSKGGIAMDSEDDEEANNNSTDLQQIKQQMAAARLQAAEKEVSALQRHLAHSKQDSQLLRQQIQQMQQQLAGQHAELLRLREADGRLPPPPPPLPTDTSAASTIATAPAATAAPPAASNVLQSAEQFLRDHTKDLPLPVAVDETEASRAFLRKVNALRREARTIISTLREHILSLQTSAAANTSMAASAKPSTAAGQIITQLREENTRKQKMILAFKAAKLSDSNALEQWKHEAKALDEQNKRLRSALSAKEALVKDLKQKELDQPAADDVAYHTMSIADLKAKCKEYDLERARLRVRMQALKDKIAELEAALASEREEVERLHKGLDKQEASKLAMQRKDAVLQAQKATIDRLKADYEAAKQSEMDCELANEKKLKSLQRQIDHALRDQEGQSKEIAMLRERLAQTHVEEPHASSSPPQSQPPRGGSRREQTRSQAPSPSPPAPAPAAWPAPLPSLRSSHASQAPQPRDHYGAMFDDSLDEGHPPTQAEGNQYHARHHAAGSSASLHDIQDVLQDLGGMRSAAGRGSSFFPAPPAFSSSAISTPSSHAASMPGSAITVSSSSTVNTAELSVEKRLQAIVNASLQSPARPSLRKYT